MTSVWISPFPSLSKIRKASFTSTSSWASLVLVLISSRNSSMSTEPPPSASTILMHSSNSSSFKLCPNMRM